MAATMMSATSAAVFVVVVVVVMLIGASAAAAQPSGSHPMRRLLMDHRHSHRHHHAAKNCSNITPPPPVAPSFSAPSGSYGVSVRATLQPRSDIVNANASLTERLAALARHDATRIEALNTQINNAIVAKAGSNGSAFAAGASFTVNAGPGVFVMQMSLGTPAQSFPMIMDTGSQLIWTQCSPCQSCVAQTAALFTPAASTTYQAVGCGAEQCQSLAGQCDGGSGGGACRYTYSYASQASTQGLMGKDTLTFSTSAAPAPAFAGLAFGCGYSNQGDYGGASGLVGMGQSSLSLPSQLGPSIGGRRFSYCLPPQPASSTLLMGSAAADPSLMTFTPIAANPSVAASLYYITVDGFSVSGQRLAIPDGTFSISPSGAGGMILDSGTTYTYLPTAAFTPIKQAFDAYLKLPPYSSHPFLPACYSAGSGTPSPPPLTLHLRGADIPLPARNYFIAVDSAGTFCLAMIPTTSGGLQIVGNMLHQEFHVLYDIDNARIGFRASDANCAS